MAVHSFGMGLVVILYTCSHLAPRYRSPSSEVYNPGFSCCFSTDRSMSSSRWTYVPPWGYCTSPDVRSAPRVAQLWSTLLAQVLPEAAR